MNRKPEVEDNDRVAAPRQNGAVNESGPNGFPSPQTAPASPYAAAPAAEITPDSQPSEPARGTASNYLKSDSADERLRLATSVARMFDWEVDVASDRMKWGENAAAVIGCDPAQLSDRRSDNLFFVDPADCDHVRKAVNDAVTEGRDTFHIEFRGIIPENSYWDLNGMIVRDVDNKEVRILGVTQNITERKQAEIQSRNWQNLFISADFGLAYVDAKTNTFLDVNPAFAAQRGYSRDELIGKPVAMMLTPETLKYMERDMAAADASGYGRYEIQERRKDGSTFPVIAEITVIKDELGRPVSRFVYALDITQRKQAEENLRISEERFRGIFGQTVVGIAQMDLETRLLMVNDRYCEMTGYSREELVGRSIRGFTHAEDFEEIEVLLERMLESGEPFQLTKRYVKKDGTIVWIDNSISLVRDEAGDPVSCVSVVIDVTNRLESERERHQLADAFENCGHGIAIVEPKTDRIIVCNPAFAQLMRGSIDDLRDRPLLSLYSPEYHGYIRKCLNEADQSGQVRYEARMRRTEGKSFPAQMDIVSVRGADGDLLYRVKTMQDVTWRKQIEDEILEKNELLEQTYDAIFVWSIEDGVILWNKNATALYGYTAQEAIGRDPYVLLRTVLPGARSDFRTALIESKRWEGELIHTAKDGSEIVVESRLSVLRQFKGKSIVMETCRDVTERKRMEIELARMSRMRVISEVAMGIAHEIKNPLAGIKGVMDILIQRRGEGNPERQVMEDVCREIERIDFTVRELLNHAQVRPIAFENVSLADTVRRAVQFANHQSSIRKRSRRTVIDSDLGTDAFVLPHDSSRMEDAVMNLILNSQEAIGDGPGRIAVKLYSDKHNAVIEVSDTGGGISDENLKKIFTPFFTTRDDGSGLGLPAVQRVIRAHGGTCEVDSKPGTGSVFRLRIPLGSRNETHPS